MLLSIIAAIGQNRELGAKNKLMWHIPGELPRFKRITTGHSIIMGRKTFESIGRVLPNRMNIIITRDRNFKVDGAIIVHSLKDALTISLPAEKGIQGHEKTTRANQPSDSLLHINSVRPEEEQREIFIIGGGQIFAESLPLVQRLYLTIVHASFPQADVFFPNYSEFTKIVEKEDHTSDEYSYTFLILEK